MKCVWEYYITDVFSNTNGRIQIEKFKGWEELLLRQSEFLLDFSKNIQIIYFFCYDCVKIFYILSDSIR